MKEYRIDKNRFNKLIYTESTFQIFGILLTSVVPVAILYSTADSGWPYPAIALFLFSIAALVFFIYSFLKFFKVMRNDYNYFKSHVVLVNENRITISNSIEKIVFNLSETEVHHYRVLAAITSPLTGKGYVVFKSTQDGRSCKVSSIVFDVSNGARKIRSLFENTSYYYKEYDIKPIKYVKSY